MKNIIRDRRFYRKLLILAVPIILQGMLNVGVNIMDTLMLSQLDESQISASSLAGSYMHLFNIMCMGVGFGVSVMGSQFWGEKNIDGFKKVTTILVRISVVIGIIGMVVTIIFPRQLMSLYTNEIEVIEAGVKYLRYISYAIFFMLLSVPLGIVLRSAGKAGVSMLATGGGFVLNIIANYVFIFGKFGAPRMEIGGAAVGTLISFIFQAAFMWIYLLVIDKDIKYRIKDIFLPCGEYIRSFLRYGAPVIVSDMLLGVGMNVVSVIMGHIGNNFVAAYAIISVIVRLTTTFTQGFSSAGGVIVGNTLGERDKDLAFRQAVTCYMISIVLGVLGAVIVVLVGKPYIDVYNISAETKAIAYDILYAAAINLTFMSTGNLLTKGVLRGGGDTRYLMVVDVIFLWCVSVPFGALAGLVWDLPVFWVYLLLRADPMLKTFFGTYRLYSKKWINIVSDDKTKKIAN